MYIVIVNMYVGVEMLQNNVSHEEILPDSECFDQNLIRIGNTVSVFTWLVTVSLVSPLFFKFTPDLSTECSVFLSVQTCPLLIQACPLSIETFRVDSYQWFSATDTNDYHQKKESTTAIHQYLLSLRH